MKNLLIAALGWMASSAVADIGPVEPSSNVPPVVLSFGAASTSAFPAWIRAVGSDGGVAGGEPSAWRAAASQPVGMGRVWIDLNRDVLNEDLALTLLYERNPASEMAVQLCDAQGRVVVVDLFRDVAAMAALARTDTFVVPMRNYPTATRIVLRRISGDVTLYGAVLGPVLTEQRGDVDMELDLLRRLGDVMSPDSALVQRIRERMDTARAVTNTTASASTHHPSAANALQLGGFEWTPFRTDFELRDDAIFPLPRARAGFEYGHWGHGRAPTIVTHLADATWRDYSVEMDVTSTGVKPGLDPHALNPAYSGYSAIFRVAGFKENWNEPGGSLCGFYVMNEGGASHWSLCATRNHYAKVDRGWFNIQSAGNFELASGDGLIIDREKGNHLRVDAQGDRIRIWYDGKQICDVTDARLHEEYQGVKLDHGGIGVSWGFDTMGWVRNVKVRKL